MTESNTSRWEIQSLAGDQLLASVQRLINTEPVDQDALQRALITARNQDLLTIVMVASEKVAIIATTTRGRQENPLERTWKTMRDLIADEIIERMER